MTAAEVGTAPAHVPAAPSTQGNGATARPQLPPGVQVFDAHEKPQPFPVREDDGTVSLYWVHPFGDGGVEKWMDIFDARLKTDDETGRVVSRDAKGLHEDLICLCVRHGESSDSKLVDRKVPEAWGTRAKLNAYIRCRNINGLDDGARLGKG